MPNYQKTPEAIKRLTAEQYRVTQQNATERPGTGEFRFTGFTTDKGTYLSTDDIHLDMEITARATRT